MPYDDVTPRWKRYEILGLMHGKYAVFGQGGYMSLMTLCEMGVRLSDIIDPTIRLKIPLSPEKARVLFEMVENLGPEKCQELCNDVNLYHLTISKEYPVSFASLESTILRSKFSILDLATMTFLEFRESTKGEGSSNLFRSIQVVIQEQQLLDSLSSSFSVNLNIQSNNIHITPYPGGTENSFYPLNSVLPHFDKNGLILSYLDESSRMRRSLTRETVLPMASMLPNERIAENRLYGKLFSRYRFSRTLFCEVFNLSPRIYRYLDLILEKGQLEVASNEFISFLEPEQLTRYLRVRNSYLCATSGQIKSYNIENIVISAFEGSFDNRDEKVLLNDIRRLSALHNPYGHHDELGCTRLKLREVVKKSHDLIRTGKYIRLLRVPYKEHVLNELFEKRLRTYRGIFSPKKIFEELFSDLLLLDIQSSEELVQILYKHRSKSMRTLSEKEIAINVTSRNDYILSFINYDEKFIKIDQLAETLSARNGIIASQWSSHIKSILDSNDDFIEVEKDLYLLTIHLLTLLDNPDDFDGFVHWALEAIPDETFITPTMIRRLDRSHPLLDMGFDESFFYSIMKKSSLLRSVTKPNEIVFYRNLSKSRHTIKDFFYSQIENAEDFDYYLIRIERKFGVPFDRKTVVRALQNTDVVISEELNRIFLDKVSYLDFVYEAE